MKCYQHFMNILNKLCAVLLVLLFLSCANQNDSERAVELLHQAIHTEPSELSGNAQFNITFSEDEKYIVYFTWKNKVNWLMNVHFNDNDEVLYELECIDGIINGFSDNTFYSRYSELNISAEEINNHIRLDCIECPNYDKIPEVVFKNLFPLSLIWKDTKLYTVVTEQIWMRTNRIQALSESNDQVKLILPKGSESDVNVKGISTYLLNGARGDFVFFSDKDTCEIFHFQRHDQLLTPKVWTFLIDGDVFEERIYSDPIIIENKFIINREYSVDRLTHVKDHDNSTAYEVVNVVRSVILTLEFD